MLRREASGGVGPSESSVQFASRTVDLARVTDAERVPLLRAFATIPRHLFLESALSPRAYEDHALPIGYGQTISKPSTIALMLSSLELQRGERVLEVGSGSGYVLALLAALGVEGFGIEKVAELARLARRRLDALGFQQVLMKSGDGKRGWPDLAPFDAIIISAAFPEVPAALFEQLTPSGRLVAPVAVATSSNPRLPHQLMVWRRAGKGRQWESHDLGACHFVHGV